MMRAPRSATLFLSFQGYWIAGTGGGKGRRLDAACHRDGHGFPAFPMSQVKGTLRETAERLAADGSGGWTPEKVSMIFGKPSDAQGSDAAVGFLGDAELPAEVCDQIGVANAPLLFERIPATRINDAGVAEDRTLRAIEAAVPLDLQGRLVWQAEREPEADWIALLDLAAAATPTLGALKNDGFGTVLARIEPATEAGPQVPPEISVGRCFRLRLVQTQRAIFSARAATEGLHKTTATPTGAALLGWLAAQGGYASFDDPFTVFHSGKVRFGTALPLLPDGAAAIPTPKLLMQPKNQVGALRVGRPQPTQDPRDFIQYEEVEEPFVAPDGRFVSPPPRAAAADSHRERPGAHRPALRLPEPCAAT